MAIVLAFRVAIVLTPVLYRAVTAAQPSTLAQGQMFVGDLWRRLTDPDEDPAVLSVDCSDACQDTVTVADFTGTFEGRRMAVRWSRAPSGGTLEDQAQTSIHFLKIASGAPASWVDNTDDATVEGLFNTLWTTLKTGYPSTTHLDVYRWYKSGPAWDLTPAPYNPAYRTTEVDVAGTGTGSVLPPQVAVSVTFKTSVRKRWGRCYLPAMVVGALTADGRLGTSGTISNNNYVSAWQTFLNGCTTAHIQPVVMSRARDAYTSPAGHEIPAQPFTAYGITAVQIDDLFDVIRSRRFSAPTSRAVQTVTAAS